MTFTITTATIIWIVAMNLFTLIVGGLIGALIVMKIFEKTMKDAERIITKARKTLETMVKEARKTWEDS